MKTQSVDTSPEAEQVQVRLLQEATVARRIRVAASLSSTTIELAREALRRRNPGVSEREISILYADLHFSEDLAKRFREFVAGRP